MRYNPKHYDEYSILEYLPAKYLIRVALVLFAISALVLGTVVSREVEIVPEEPTVPIENRVPVSSAPPEEVEEIPEVIHYTETEVVMIAKTLYNEARGVKSDTEKACVVWTILNRYDTGKYGSTIADVVAAPNQFAYNPDTPVTEELYALALDVVKRWNSEKNGKTDVGRVLPKEYIYFSGNYAKNPKDPHNFFRIGYKDYKNVWDYSLESPYNS